MALGEALCSRSNYQTLVSVSNPSSFSSLPLYRVWTWSGLGHLAPGSHSPALPLSSASLCTSLWPDGSGASSWEGLNGTGPFQTQHRPLTRHTGRENSETVREKSPEPSPGAFHHGNQQGAPSASHDWLPPCYVPVHL